MRSSINQFWKSNKDGEMLHVDIHRFDEEQLKTGFEAGDEVGLSLDEVKVLKRKLRRN